MKRKVTVITLLTVAVILLTFAGCGSNKSTAKKSETYNETAAQIESVLQKVPAEEGWAPSIAEMINTAFHRYEWSYVPYEDSETKYIVTFSGSFCPYPASPQTARDGSISYLVDIVAEEATVYDDPDHIESTFLVYILDDNH